MQPEHIALLIGAVGGSFVQPVLSFILKRLKTPAEVHTLNANADKIEAAAALDYSKAQEANLARCNELFVALQQRDAVNLEQNRKLTELQIEMHRIERLHSAELEELRGELASRDATIDELRVELDAERKLRQMLQKRLAEIDPEFSLVETETKA